MRLILILLGLACLAACLVLPSLYFLGEITGGQYKSLLLWVSAGWFVCASLGGFRAKPKGLG